ADITGYWVSVVTEDWRYRMVTPPKGDRPSIPVNAAAIAVLNAWDPAKDEAAGEQCKAYGAVGAMRQPGRLHITWADENTLKIDVPYSANAVLTEYFNRTTEPNGDSWLILTTTVDDPQYLNMPFVRSTHYKRLPDNFSGWEPEACSAR